MPQFTTTWHGIFDVVITASTQQIIILIVRWDFQVERLTPPLKDNSWLWGITTCRRSILAVSKIYNLYSPIHTTNFIHYINRIENKFVHQLGWGSQIILMVGDEMKYFRVETDFIIIEVSNGKVATFFLLLTLLPFFLVCVWTSVCHHYNLRPSLYNNLPCYSRTHSTGVASSFGYR